MLIQYVLRNSLFSLQHKPCAFQNNRRDLASNQIGNGVQYITWNIRFCILLSLFGYYRSLGKIFVLERQNFIENSKKSTQIQFSLTNYQYLLTSIGSLRLIQMFLRFENPPSLTQKAIVSDERVFQLAKKYLKLYSNFRDRRGVNQSGEAMFKHLILYFSEKQLQNYFPVTSRIADIQQFIVTYLELKLQYNVKPCDFFYLLKKIAELWGVMKGRSQLFFNLQSQLFITLENITHRNKLKFLQFIINLDINWTLSKQKYATNI